MATPATRLSCAAPSTRATRRRWSSTATTRTALTERRRAMVISITSRRRPWTRWALAVVGLLTLVLVRWLGPDSGGSPPAANAPVAQPAAADRWIQPGVPTPAQDAMGTGLQGLGEDGPVRIGTVKPFRTDASGALALDADTVVTLEQLVAFSTPEQFNALAREAAANLPPPAQVQALDLAQRFDRDLQALQVMRHDHFGAQAALQLFGDQEAVTARLIELMTQDTQVDAPLQERAMRAQARFLVERDGRNSGGG